VRRGVSAPASCQAAEHALDQTGGNADRGPHDLCGDPVRAGSVVLACILQSVIVSAIRLDRIRRMIRGGRGLQIVWANNHTGQGLVQLLVELVQCSDGWSIHFAGRLQWRGRHHHSRYVNRTELHLPSGNIQKQHAAENFRDAPWHRDSRMPVNISWIATHLIDLPKDNFEIPSSLLKSKVVGVVLRKIFPWSGSRHL